LLVYNDENAYLFGAHTPPDGWEMREGVYISDQDRDWQAFAEELGDGTWVGSMSTKTALDLFLVRKVGSIVPDALEPVVPLGLVVTSTEHYITALLHEAFHAYQAEAAPARFADAQLAYAYEEVYDRAAEAMDERWKEEARLLARALGAKSDDETADLVRQWLRVRSAGRADLDPELIAYERRLEWLEGLAKYAELGIWEAASEADDYEPLDSLAVDDRFRGYAQFERRLQGEVATLRTSATRSGDGRFYYTGMAQARLLDRLMPEWHRQAFQAEVWLDDLLDKAVG
jgi:hypothetical protein